MKVKNLHLHGETLGAHLKRKRRESGISLMDLAKKTQIRVYYLEKIEAGEFHNLPCLPYSRGFVRVFATYIGLDADVVVEQFNAETGLEAA